MSKTSRKWWIAGAALIAAAVLALLLFPKQQKTVQTGNLLVNGDFSRVTAKELDAFVGGGDGRVQR